MESHRVKVHICHKTTCSVHVQVHVDSLDFLQPPFYVHGWRPLDAAYCSDVRSITDEQDRLPYDLAQQGCFCYASILLDPTASIENVLEFECTPLDGKVLPGLSCHL